MCIYNFLALKNSTDDSIKLSDEELLAIFLYRYNKVKTLERFEPSGKYGSHQETLMAFNSKRVEDIIYTENTEDYLRNHYGQLPFRTIDAYQIL